MPVCVPDKARICEVHNCEDGARMVRGWQVNHRMVQDGEIEVPVRALPWQCNNSSRWHGSDREKKRSLHNGHKGYLPARE